MRKDLTTSLVAIVVFTILLGLGYPLLVTGVGQVAFPNKANGSRIERGGRTLGSRLIGQDFRGDPRYFQSRPSQTSYDPAGTAFANRGPNSRQLAAELRANVAAYLRLEGPYNPGLTVSKIPPDAVTTSASGVDPQISPANARIQAARISAVRHLPRARVLALIARHTSGRVLGFAGDPGVNVLELNLALDQEAVDVRPR